MQSRTQELLGKVEKQSLKGGVPDCRPGDTVRVMVKVTETSGKEERTRLQTFEGVVIGREGGGIDETIRVRRVTHGVGVERVFPLHSPTVDDVVTVRHGRVRRAKLYYLRQRVGKKARVREQERDVVVAREKAARERADAAAAAARAAAEAEAAAAAEAEAKAAAAAAEEQAAEAPDTEQN